VNKIMALSLLLTATSVMQQAGAQSTTGHENNCLVTNVGSGEGTMHVICASGSINYAFLTGGPNDMSPGTCPTVGLDNFRMLNSMALAARVSGLWLTIWYTHGCTGGTLDIHAITGFEMQNN
jgi:hypothetical protein